MKLGFPFAIALSALAGVDAGVIDYDKVQPFPEPEPNTISERAAVKFKPKLLIKHGCHPYAAVDAAGDMSGGLDPKTSDDECKGSALGSQVYSRSAWHRDTWVIMYAWYFPKDTSATALGFRHDWVNAIVWLDNPALENQRLVGVTFLGDDGYYKELNPELSSEFMNGTHPRLAYSLTDWLGGYHTITDAHDSVTDSFQDGELQDLIHWSQLTDKAHNALQTGDFGSVTPVPFNDANFEKNIEQGVAGETLGVYY